MGVQAKGLGVAIMTTTSSWTVRCLAVTMFVGFPAVAAAQTAGTGDCGYETAGTVRGVVVNDSTGAPVPGSYIYLFLTPDCRARTDALGRFVVRGVPPGTHRVETGMSGYRRFVPIDVAVMAGDTTYVELRLEPGGPLDDCRALAACSLLLERGSLPADNDDFGFRVVALGTAIGLAWRTVSTDGRWFACVQDEPKVVLETLGDRYSPVADAESCEIGADPSGAQHHRLLHVATTRPAFQLLIEGVVMLSRTRRTVSLGYVFGPHGGAGWDCDFVRTEQGWRATLCIQTWES